MYTYARVYMNTFQWKRQLCRQSSLVGVHVINLKTLKDLLQIRQRNKKIKSLRVNSIATAITKELGAKNISDLQE